MRRRRGRRVHGRRLAIGHCGRVHVLVAAVVVVVDVRGRLLDVLSSLLLLLLLLAGVELLL